MPKKPKKPCRFPGCPNLTDGFYCEIHSKTGQEEKKDREYYRTHYGGKWRKARDAYFKQHPYCEKCFSEGKITKAVEVHHIKPVREGGTNETENLISLCRRCHNKIHIDRGDRKVFQNKEYFY